MLLWVRIWLVVLSRAIVEVGDGIYVSSSDDHTFKVKACPPLSTPSLSSITPLFHACEQSGYRPLRLSLTRGVWLRLPGVGGEIGLLSAHAARALVLGLQHAGKLML